MAQIVKVYGVGPKVLSLRTATRFRYVIVLAHPSAQRLVKYASSDSLAAATRKLDKAMRSPLWMQSVGVVVDLVAEIKIAQQSGARAQHVAALDVRVTGSRGR